MEETAIKEINLAKKVINQKDIKERIVLRNQKENSEDE